MQDIDPKGLDTAFWASVTKEDIYEYLYFLNRECGNKKSSTARRLASLHGFYDYLVNQVNRPVSYTHLGMISIWSALISGTTMGTSGVKRLALLLDTTGHSALA